jgi:hypothetical protein
MATTTSNTQAGTAEQGKTKEHLDLPTQARLAPAVVKRHGDKLSEAFRQ